MQQSNLVHSNKVYLPPLRRRLIREVMVRRHPPLPGTQAKLKSEEEGEPPSNAQRRDVVLISIREVVAYTSLSRASIYARLNKKSPYFDSTFPRQIKLGRRVAWDLDDIQMWIAAQPKGSEEASV